MITIKVNYENGDNFITRINCNFDEARKYYIDNIFNIGAVEDNMQKCIGIELIAFKIGDKEIIRGQKYRHKESGCIWNINNNIYGNLVFDSGIIQREIFPYRLDKVELITD